MRTIRMRTNEFEAYAVRAEIKGNVEEYAMAFLHIFNNVRESRELFKVENSYNNDVTVYCELEVKDKLEEYLKMFGEIKSCDKVLMYQLLDDTDYDFDKYDDAVVVPYFD